MKKSATTLCAVAAAAMIAAPVAAAERYSAPVEGESEIGGEYGVIVGVLAIAAIIAGIIIIADSDDADSAVSP